MKQGIKISLLLYIPLALGLTSCLKDVKSPTDPGGSNNVVEFQNSSIPVSYTSIYYQYANSLLFPPGVDTAGFNVNINYAGSTFLAPQDITVTLAMDTAALSAFNASESKNFVVGPADIFSFPSTITIPKGQNLGQIRVIVTKAADFDFSAQYVIPLKIASSSYGIVSTNFGTVMYTYVGRNKYDGLYTMTMKALGWGAYSGLADGPTYTWPTNINFLTTSGTSNTLNTNETGNGQPAFTATGGLSSFGATQTQFTFDGTTDKLINVNNLVPDDGRGRAFMLNPAVTDSRYDATGSTPIIYAAYIMVQTGRPPQYIYDTLTYQGPRP